MGHFSKTSFLAVSDHSEHFSKNRVGVGQGGSKRVKMMTLLEGRR